MCTRVTALVGVLLTKGQQGCRSLVGYLAVNRHTQFRKGRQELPGREAKLPREFGVSLEMLLGERFDEQRTPRTGDVPPDVEFWVAAAPWPA